MKRGLAASFALLFFSLSPVAHADEEPAPGTTEETQPRRAGFTLELGIGGSFMNVESDRESMQKFGLAPLSLGLGGFFSRDIALTFRMTGASIIGSDNGQTTQTLVGFYGPAMQYYPSEHFYVGAGVGLGLYATNNPLLATPSHPAVIESGLAFDARVGWVLVASRAHQLSLMSEIIPGKFEDATALGVTLAVGYQFF